MVCFPYLLEAKIGINSNTMQIKREFFKGEICKWLKKRTIIFKKIKVSLNKWVKLEANRLT